MTQEANANTERARERWLKALAEAGLATFLAVWEGPTSAALRESTTSWRPAASCASAP